MRVWVVDPGTRHPGGHHVTFDMGILEQCSRLGLPVVFFVHKDFVRSFAKAGMGNPLLPALPVFPFCQHDVPLSSGRAAVLTKQCNDAFLQILDQVLSNTVCSGDIVILHTVDIRFLNGLARWLVKELTHKSFKTIIQLSGLDFVSFSEVPDWMRSAYQGSLEPLARLGPERVTLLAETEGLRTLYRDVTGVDCALEQAPHFKPEAPIRQILEQPRATSEPPNIGFLGQLRLGRGIANLPQAIVAFCRRHPNAATFEVQAAEPPGQSMEALENACPGFRAGLEHLKELDGVNLIQRTLSTRDYYDLLGRVDIVLQLKTGLPSIIGSGVVLEALAAGKINVLPEGSEQHRTVVSAGAPLVTIPRLEPDAIAGALWEAVNNIETLRPKALAAAEIWNRDRSLTAFFDRLVAA